MHAEHIVKFIYPKVLKPSAKQSGVNRFRIFFSFFLHLDLLISDDIITFTSGIRTQSEVS